jgi:hypothetical protein
MYRTSGINRSVRTVLAVLAAGALGLAASPAALAKDRGGPGQPGAQRTAIDSPVPVLPRKLLSGRFVSWSD